MRHRASQSNRPGCQQVSHIPRLPPGSAANYLPQNEIPSQGLSASSSLKSSGHNGRHRHPAKLQGFQHLQEQLIRAGFILPSYVPVLCLAYCCYNFIHSSFVPAHGAYLHGCPILDVILLSQLLAGEIHVLLPQPLALPTCFLKKKEENKH